MVAQFFDDGDHFKLVGQSKTYNIVCKKHPHALVEYDLLEYDTDDSFRGHRVIYANISFGDLIEYPAYVPD